jgi:uncharacterized membrane-anchored protein
MQTPTAPHRPLPPDDVQRIELHNEVHARPPTRLTAPALVVLVAVSHEGVSREQACEHLRQLSGQEALQVGDFASNFLRLNLPGASLTWERHTEFTRYTLAQPLPATTTTLAQCDPDALLQAALPPGWLAGIGGRTFAAVQLVLLQGDPEQAHDTLAQAHDWLGGDHAAVASITGGQSNGLVATDFVLRESGFERIVVITAPGTTDTRAGRIAQRVLEIETYRLMALRGLPMVKSLGPLLSGSERQLAEITAQMENKSATDEDLLDTLVALAAGVERATAEHSYRFAATAAYDVLVAQRIAELRERAIPGTQTIGEFMQRRLSPAIATVAASGQRLASLSERISRASALLRTRVDIATEAQNQLLLEKLTRGQALQLRLQATVEGLSIAAISYYVVSLLYYGIKALKAGGAPINAEVTIGAVIPLVLWAVWYTTRRIHKKLRAQE